MTLGKYTDYDQNLVGTHPIYHWRTDPDLSIDRDELAICWQGVTIGKYMIRGKRKDIRSADAESYVQVMLLKDKRELFPDRRTERLKRLLAAVLLYRKVKETAEKPLVSRIKFRFVDQL
jgi:hypothetical protein